MATLFLALIYAAFVSLGLPDSLLGSAWPVMRQSFGAPAGYAGLISMTVSFGTVVSSLLSGHLIKRFGTGRVTFTSVLMTAAALLGFSFSGSFAFLILFAVPLGLGAGAVDAGLNEYVAEHYTSRHMNWLHCFWGVGAMTGPIILSQCISHSGSWRSGYFIVSMIQFALTAVLAFSLPMWNRGYGTAESGNKPDEACEPQPDPSAGTEAPFMLFKAPGVWAVLISFMLYSAAELTLGLWGSSFFVGARGVSAAQAAGWTSVFYGSITAGRFITGFVATRLGDARLIRIGTLTIIAGAVLMLLPAPAYVSLLGYMLTGLGCAPVYPCMLHETPVRFGKERARYLMGYQMAVAYFGSTFMPPLFGLASSVTGIGALPFFIFAFSAIIFICRLTVKGKAEEQ
jgi:fucose permease